MKTTINGFEVEGTVDEIRALLNLQVQPSVAPVRAKPTTKTNNNPKTKKHSQANRSNIWSVEEDDFLMANRYQYTVKQLSRKIKKTFGKVRTKSAIANRMFHLKRQGRLPRDASKSSSQDKTEKINGSKLRRWSQQEKSIVETYKDTKTTKEISDMIMESCGIFRSSNAVLCEIWRQEQNPFRA